MTPAADPSPRSSHRMSGEPFSGTPSSKSTLTGSPSSAAALSTSTGIAQDVKPGANMATPTGTSHIYDIDVGHEDEVTGNSTTGRPLFQYSSVQARPGDQIWFHFYGSYELYLSSLPHPCTSSFASLNDVPPSGNMSTYRFLVQTTAPVWFFGRLDGTASCDEHSVFAVNPGEELHQFVANAHQS